MEAELKILILEDNPADAELIIHLLRRERIHCVTKLTKDRPGFMNALDEFGPDVILSDNTLPQFDASEALRITRQRFMHIPFILVTGTVSEEFAATIIKQGADDYILKDRMVRLPAAIKAALNQRKILKEITDYKYALDQAAEISITDQKGTIIYANDNFCSLAQYAVQDLIGKDHRIINSGYHSSSFMKDLWVTISNGKIWRGELRNRAKDGSFYWQDTTIVPFLNDAGKPYQYLAIQKDISLRKQAERELLESKERFEYATRASSDIIWEINFEERRFLVHEGREQLFGANTVIDWQLIALGDYIHPDEKAKVKESFNVARFDLSRTLWDLEYRVYSQEGSILFITNHAIFIRDEKGKAMRVIGAITDISQRKELEGELLDQQKNEQLKLTATALEAQEVERNLLGQELHDNVNQILVGTKLLLSMIKDETPKVKELIKSSIQNLQHAIDENRKLSHRLVTPDLELDNLEKQISDLASDMLQTAGVRSTVDTLQMREYLMSEAQKIAVYRIAQEQCTNIIKYANAHNVSIVMETRDQLFKMSITDDGVGMDTAKATKGIGLRNITGRMSVFNGTATVTSNPGKGFKLQIEMPIKPGVKI